MCCALYYGRSTCNDFSRIVLIQVSREVDSLPMVSLWRSYSLSATTGSAAAGAVRSGGIHG